MIISAFAVIDVWFLIRYNNMAMLPYSQALCMGDG